MDWATNTKLDLKWWYIYIDVSVLYILVYFPVEGSLHESGCLKIQTFKNRRSLGVISLRASHAPFAWNRLLLGNGGGSGEGYEQN